MSAEDFKVADAIDRVRALHLERSEEGISWACAEGDCDHDECHDGGESPTQTFKVCAHCMAIAEDNGLTDEAWPSFVMYPCATIRALDLGLQTALLNGGSR